jgi:hypothetical protein
MRQAAQVFCLGAGERLHIDKTFAMNRGAAQRQVAFTLRPDV